ncbi:MAG TPA: aromatic ring-hydroxylating dioxygenase subunit alpha [Mycobacteriales bacterium]|nr:aromatic ring-hydroxylating dioxygenase subunit alpha [Mycobacteriales bacterium]
MDLATQHQLIERILTHLDRRTTDAGGEERYVPVSDYLDPQLYAAEVEAAHRSRPLIVGHASQLAEPGDFRTDEVAGTPVLLVRDAAGQIRCHVNVCRHRGFKLVDQPAGSGLAEMICGYHAWTYDPSGELRHIPDQKRCFPGVDKADRGLLPMSAWVDQGFIWVDPATAPTARRATADELDPRLLAELAGYGFAEDSYYGGKVIDGAFNWKLGVEAFLEVYHFQILHPAMKNYVFAPEVALIDHFGDDIRLVAPKKEILKLRDVPREQWRLRPRVTVVYYLFPATFLFVEKRHASVLQIRPTGVETSRAVTFHFARTEGLRRLATLDRNIGGFLQALDEDLAACESIQAGLRSGQEHLLFGRNENALHAFRDMLSRRVAAAGGRTEVGVGTAAGGR